VSDTIAEITQRMLKDINIIGVAGNLGECGTEQMAVVEKEFLRLSLCP
jgi:hypothetical protein